MTPTSKQTVATLELLKRKGKYGASNKELSNISLQYNYKIYELRHDYGYEIHTRRMYRNGKASYTYVYYLVGKPKYIDLTKKPEATHEPKRRFNIKLWSHIGA